MDRLYRIVQDDNGHQTMESYLEPDLDGATWFVFEKLQLITKDGKVYSAEQRSGQFEDEAEVAHCMGHIKTMIKCDLAKDQGKAC